MEEINTIYYVHDKNEVLLQKNYLVNTILIKSISVKCQIDKY